MGHAWHYLVVFGLFLGPHILAAIIRRAKRGSERWQQRSERQQRLLALLPGGVIMIVTAILLDVFNVPW